MAGRRRPSRGPRRPHLRVEIQIRRTAMKNSAAPIFTRRRNLRASFQSGWSSIHRSQLEQVLSRSSTRARQCGQRVWKIMEMAGSGRTAMVSRAGDVAGERASCKSLSCCSRPTPRGRTWIGCADAIVRHATRRSTEPPLVFLFEPTDRGCATTVRRPSRHRGRSMRTRPSALRQNHPGIRQCSPASQIGSQAAECVEMASVYRKRMAPERNRGGAAGYPG